ncbi:MAG: 3-phosphoshikimate 1-carboxyvinyltransferase [Treponema sp.]|nr:3-phosphoshikimate 1-carboxyvinyltransferase [Treponema sp.]
MKVKAHKSKLNGHITVPGSKSHTIRALILAAIADGKSHISNPLPSNDCLSTVEAIKKVGAKAELSDGLWTVTGAGKNLHIPEEAVDAGNSGSLMYFLCPVLSTLKGDCTFTGDESLCTRPVGHLLDALNQLGADAKSLRGNDCCPFSFSGPIDVNKSLITDGKLSQYISGFMMAASRLNGTLNIKLSEPKETPYLTMTKLWLESVGVNCNISKDFKEISVKGPVQIKAFDRAVPSDWEGVAFPLIAALISDSSIVIENIDGSGSQGDDKIVEVLRNVGADIIWDKEKATLTVKGGKKLSGNQSVCISDFPDAICALSVIACFIEGTTTFTDVEICRKKETDRIKAMKCELTKLGADVEEGPDCLIVHGHSPILEDGSPNPDFKLHGGEVQTYKDHRIVMSLSCLALGLRDGEELLINDSQWCNITFPRFFEVMNTIGSDFLQLED